MKAVVTGAAGFVGSNLVDRLLADGHEVWGIDNFSTGQRRFVESALTNARFHLVEIDLLDAERVRRTVEPGIDHVFHMAANADVRFGLVHPRQDLEQNTIATSNVLEAMRAAKVPAMTFASTGAVYGDHPTIPTPEDAPFPIQTSLYGASKVAAEGMISAYAEGYGMRANVCRFVSLLGPRYTHGHVFDFVKQLLRDPSKLTVLGDGTQRKSYLYIGDCIEAMLRLATRSDDAKVGIYNLGTDEWVDVSTSISVICKTMGVQPKLELSGGKRGWVGDNPFVFLDCSKLKSTGWRATKTIRESVQLTTQYLLENRWVFEARG